jgi:hypothetical protein
MTSSKDELRASQRSEGRMSKKEEERRKMKTSESDGQEAKDFANGIHNRMHYLLTFKT